MSTPDSSSQCPQIISLGNICKLTALILAIGGGIFGVWMMIQSEFHMTLPDNFITLDPASQQPFIRSMITKGLQPYCKGFGLLLILAGIAYVALGYNDRTHTNLQSPDEDDND